MNDKSLQNLMITGTFTGHPGSTLDAACGTNIVKLDSYGLVRDSCDKITGLLLI